MSKLSVLIPPDGRPSGLSTELEPYQLDKWLKQDTPYFLSTAAVENLQNRATFVSQIYYRYVHLSLK